MRIALTNDDGIRGEGLRLLLDWASRHGEVTVVAPKEEQSGKSHSIELHRPFEVLPVDMPGAVKAMSVDSAPADCVRFALLGLEETFDLVISGVNKGFNIGTDMIYSGTVGAACEAAGLGLKAIALSTSPGYYNHAHEHLDRVFDFVFSNKLLDVWDLYNINIPPQPQSIRITRQGSAYYFDDYKELENGMYMPMGKCVHRDNGSDELDTNMTIRGHITITPITIDKTNLQVYRALQAQSLEEK